MDAIHQDTHAAKLKVGELARRTGLTVRTLHHYDEIGLLRPSERTAAGHRLYTAADVERLQRVVALRQLDLSLEEIAECLDRPGHSALEVLEMCLERLEERIELEQRLHRRLRAAASRLRTEEQPSVDELLQTIEDITMLEAHFTPEQREKLAARRQELGDDAIRQAENTWGELIADVRAARDAGTDPASAEARALHARWQELVGQFTGGDAGIEASVGQVWQAEGENLRERHGDGVPSAEDFAYIGQIAAALDT